MADDEKISAPVRKRVAKARTAVRAAGARASEISEDVRDDLTNDMEDRVASLGTQIAELTHQVEQFAEDRWDDARELAAGVEHASTVAARRVGRSTVAAARAVRDDPLPMIVGLGVLALLAAFVLGQSGPRSR